MKIKGFDRGTGEMVQKISRWVVDEFENLEVLNIEHWMFREPNTLRKGFCFDFTGIPGLRILSVNEKIHPFFTAYTEHDLKQRLIKVQKAEIIRLKNWNLPDVPGLKYMMLQCFRFDSLHVLFST